MPDIKWTISADDQLTPALERQAEAYQRVQQAAGQGIGRPGATGGAPAVPAGQLSQKRRLRAVQAQQVQPSTSKMQASVVAQTKLSSQRDRLSDKDRADAQKQIVLNQKLADRVTSAAQQMKAAANQADPALTRITSLVTGFVGYRAISGILGFFKGVDQLVTAAVQTNSTLQSSSAFLNMAPGTAYATPLSTLQQSTLQTAGPTQAFGAEVGTIPTAAQIRLNQMQAAVNTAPGSQQTARALSGLDVFRDLRELGQKGMVGIQDLVNKYNVATGAPQVAGANIKSTQDQLATMTSLQSVLGGLSKGTADYNSVLGAITKQTNDLNVAQQKQNMSLQQQSLDLSTQITLLDRKRQIQQGELGLANSQANITRMQRGAIDVYSSQGQADIQALPGAKQDFGVQTQNFAFMLQSNQLQDKQIALNKLALNTAQKYQLRGTAFSQFQYYVQQAAAANPDDPMQAAPDVIAYARQLGIIPPDDTSTTTGAINFLNKVPGGISGYGGGKARGGTVSQGGWYTVGERGPEPLHVGAGGGYILPHNSGGQATPGGASGGVVEHVVTHLCPECMNKWVEHPRTAARIARGLGGLRRQ